MEKEKNILVIGKNNCFLSKTTRERAQKIVDRGRAKWIGSNRILLLITYSEQRKIQRRIKENSGRICYICGEKVVVDNLITIDHVIPKKFGGKDEEWNLRCCCFRCNKDKGCQSIGKYLEHINANRKDYLYITDNKLNELREFVETFYQNLI
ncbi:HNH endonuclease [Turicibacter sanguinis]|uniref:HNH endonuclease n=1 Tax=Turicibacter sanguinis TaxID=154288 RepID=UPI0023304AE0|nr:HNH endonuclease signature motif containing protein [Turicibacter sanguinis]MDB8574481.1 HNH endonuclease signature motif containing protein [Turicibacter sanguinis]MDB8579510.1 HNH endonuclease signature motif containing protein [Turicibacter sanguinis]MDB8583520.1 HNH endonuclease signature motif containing protein [Turicibacter sanguinis]MDB8586391.1 HNH endonuclease signature motif containing protein [Turicibacter sanguinis]MDB8596992.1 HNH endonuclease signature motif containing protei